MLGDSIQRGRAGVFRPAFLGVLDLFPLRPDGIDRAGIHVAEDMRVAPDELGDELPADLFKIKRAALARELAMKYHLQKQVAQLLDQLVVVARLDRVHQLIHFFDGVEAQAHVVLLAVPGAAARGTKPGHYAEQVVDRAAVFFHGAWRTKHWILKAPPPTSYRDPSDEQPLGAGSARVKITGSPGHRDAPLRRAAVAGTGFRRRKIWRCRARTRCRSSRKCGQCRPPQTPHRCARHRAAAGFSHSRATPSSLPHPQTA